jgi:hypothetical protein
VTYRRVIKPRAKWLRERTKVRGYRGHWEVWCQVSGIQNFQVGGDLPTKAEAEWMADQFANALQSFLDDYTGRPTA